MEQHAHFSSRIVQADGVCARDAEAWAALESRAIEPNAFLSPHFIIPSARYLTPDAVPQVLIVERHEGTRSKLVGVAVLSEAGATRQTPVRTLVGYRSRHSFLSGLLLDRDCAEESLEAMLGFIRAEMPHCKALGVPLVWSDGPLATPGGMASKTCQYVPTITDRTPRAILRPQDCDAHLRDKALSKRIRDLDRRQRRLSQLGKLEWRCHRADGIPAASIEAFLALENMGWKGEEQSSLRSRPEDEAFFREMVAAFATQRRVIFTELALDGVPIASICNLVSGNAGFCFKIGWNPEFRSASPAMINELEFMRNAMTHFADIEYFDSGAGTASFINELWMARREVSTIHLPTGMIGAGALRAVDMASQVKWWARRSGHAIARAFPKEPVPERMAKLSA